MVTAVRVEDAAWLSGFERQAGLVAASSMPKQGTGERALIGALPCWTSTTPVALWELVAQQPVNQSAVGRSRSTTNLRIFGAGRAKPEVKPRFRKLSSPSLVAARSARVGMIGGAATLAAGTS